MTTFLTVKEAARRVKKSPSSIRRIIHPVVRSDNHPDRPHVQPTVEEAVQLRLKGETFPWRISEELLRRSCPIDSRAAADEKSVGGHGDGALLAMLRRELDIKNNQIQHQAEMNAKQMQLIESLSERIREGNILIGSLQQQLALPYPAPQRDTADSKAVPSSAKAVKEKETAKHSAKKRRRWFGW